MMCWESLFTMAECPLGKQWVACCDYGPITRRQSIHNHDKLGEAPGFDFRSTSVTMLPYKSHYTGGWDLTPMKPLLKQAVKVMESAYSPRMLSTTIQARANLPFFQHVACGLAELMSEDGCDRQPQFPILANLTMHIAGKQKLPTMILLKSQSPTSFVVNLLLWRIRRNWPTVAQTALTGPDFVNLIRVLGQLSQTPLLIGKIEGWNLNTLRTTIHRAVASHAIKIVVLEDWPLNTDGSTLSEDNDMLKSITHLSRTHEVGIVVVDRKRVT